MSRIDLDLTDEVAANEMYRTLLATSREYDVPITSECLVMFVEKLKGCDPEKDSLFPLIPVTKTTAIEGRVRSVEKKDDLPRIVTLIVVKGGHRQQVIATITYDDRSTPDSMKLEVQ